MTPTPPFKLNRAFGDAKVSLTTVTDSPVIVAIAKNKPFPEHTGEISALKFSTGAGETLKFGDANRGTVKFGLKAEARKQLGLYDGGEIPRLLELDDAKKIGLDFGDARYVVFMMGYEVEGSVSGSHPLGVVGSAKFGVTAKRERSLAVAYRYDEAMGARDALGEVFRSWQAPATVTEAADLAEGALLLTEVEGSLALKLSASLGYDFSFVREVEGLGLTGDVGLKLDLGLKATLGFDVAGRYLVALERTGAKTLRLRLFKLNQNGWNFGLNLSAKAETVTLLPDETDDFVKAVFGVHGQQVVRDLQLIDKWTDPKKPWAVQLAGLARETGMELLSEVAGMSDNSGQSFGDARKKVSDAVKLWTKLPDRVSGWLWQVLEKGQLDGARRVVFENTLRMLASPAGETRQKELTRILGLTGIDDQHGLQFIVSFADHGVAAVLDDSNDLREAASRVLEVLDGGVIEKLQKFILKKLNLEQIVKFGQDGGMNKVDQWLANRLTNFLGKKFDLDRVDEVRTAIRAVTKKRVEIYEKARKAVERQYDFDVAFQYQSATERTALIDATFDTSKAGAQKMLAAVLDGGNYDEFLVERVAGVTLHNAVLTHQIKRSASVEVALPFYQSKTETITTSLAKVKAEEECGRVLFYSVDASDKVQENRLRSQVAMTGSMALEAMTGVRIHNRDRQQWTYRLDQVILGARRDDLVHRAKPLIDQYFPGHFAAGGDGSFASYLSNLDVTIEKILGNGLDTFGDLLVSFDVAMPSAAVAAWFAPRTKAESQEAARRASLRIQEALQRVIPFFHFEDINNLNLEPANAALFAFASLPPLNGFVLDANGAMKPSKRVIWDVARLEEIAAVLALPETGANMARQLFAAHGRLLAANRKPQADRLVATTVSVKDNEFFRHLLNLMSRTVHGAESALDEMRKFHEASAKEPARAVEALAKFGELMTRTFHSELKTVYGTRALRVLGSVVFLEAARELDASLVERTPKAVLCATVLKTKRKFAPQDFLKNQRPEPDDIALEQRLVQG